MKRWLVAAAAAITLCLTLLGRGGFAQSENAGTWSIHPSSQAGSVELELVSRHEPTQKWDDRQTVTISAQRLGLTQAQVGGPPAQHSFVIRSDAGSVEFNGTVGDDVGAGHFAFTPDRGYSAQLARRGIDAPPDRKLLFATIEDLTLAYIDAMARAGYPSKKFSELMSFRALDITPESAQRLRAAFGAVDAKQLVELTALHVTPEYAKSLRDTGIGDLDLHEIVEMKALGVDAGFVQSLRAQGYPGISSREVVEVKALHVDADYINELASAGYSHLPLRQLVELKSLHVDKAYIQRLEAHGLKHLTPEQLVRLKATGV